jgi:hypothetical protein
MRMNGDQEGRARKMVAVSSSIVTPALPGALCAALALNYMSQFNKIQNIYFSRMNVIGRVGIASFIFLHTCSFNYQPHHGGLDPSWITIINYAF